MALYVAPFTILSVHLGLGSWIFLLTTGVPDKWFRG